MTLLYSALGILLVCLLGWWWQVRTHNATHADVIWAGCVGAASLYYLLCGNGAWAPRLGAGLLIFAWSGRLAWHISKRLLGQPEDGRYQAMRAHYGDRINRFHLVFFLGQGVLAWLFALPAWVLASYPPSVNTATLIAGLILGGLALLGESVADRQLARFRDDRANRGITCRQGWWRYSRHPNYFFEWLHWLAWPILAWGIPFGGWVWLAPLVMYMFVRFGSGVPYTELQALKSRGENYRHYQQTTSAFFPWRPGS